MLTVRNGHVHVRLAAGDATLASHVAEWATRAAPTDRDAQSLKRDVYAKRLAEEPSLMARGIFRAAMHDAERALGEEPSRRVEAAGMSIVRPGRG